MGFLKGSLHIFVKYKQLKAYFWYEYNAHLIYRQVSGLWTNNFRFQRIFYHSPAFTAITQK